MSETQTSAPITNQQTDSPAPLYSKFKRGHTNRTLLNLAWLELGFPPLYPVDTATLSMLVRRCGYRISPHTVTNFIQAGYIEAPKIRKGRGGSFQWSQSELVAFLDALHEHRAFDPVSSIHLGVLTPTEREMNSHATFKAGAELAM